MMSLAVAQRRVGDATDAWTQKAPCYARGDQLFVAAADQKQAKEICSTCPMRLECLADALDHRIEWGVWGGLTERERRAVLRKRPNVTSWRKLLESARDRHEQAGSGQRVG